MAMWKRLHRTGPEGKNRSDNVDNRFNQVRVTELVGDIEVDVGDGKEAIMRLFLRSQTADQLAVEIPSSMWPQIHLALAAAITKFPGGGLRQ